MSKSDTTRTRKNLQPVPDNKPLELANSPASWRQLGERIEKAVDTICEDFDQEVVDALLLLSDLLGNPEFTPGFREGVLRTIQKYTYRYTEESQSGLEAYLDRLNPGRKRRAS